MASETKDMFGTLELKVSKGKVGVSCVFLARLQVAVSAALTTKHANTPY